MTTSKLSTSDIPIINLSSSSPATAREILSAASSHGFLFIANDGTFITPNDIDSMFRISQEFFSTPLSRKSEYAIHSEQAGGINRGWVRMQGESLDPSGQKQGDPKEAFNISPPSPTQTLQPLPPPLSSHTDLIRRFQTSCHLLCTQILSLLGTALEISDASYFATRHDQSKGTSGSIFRLLYYPATSRAESREKEKEESSIRAGAHSDYGSITLLFRLPGQPGLELLSPSGQWTPVPIDPSATPSSSAAPPILVNIGDLLSFWTAGLLKSTVHRVTFAGRGEERYSIAYFCHPLDDVRLDPVPSPVIQAFGEKGKEELGSQRRVLGLGESGEGGMGVEVLTAKEHLDRRLKVTYGIKC